MFDGLDKGAQVILVGAHDVVRWADHLRPHVAKMAEGSGGRYETGDIFAALAAGRMIPWVVLDGAEILCLMLAEIIAYPRLRVMRCVGVSGHDHRRWAHLLGDVEKAARERFGCDRMEALHQPRHALLLKTGGWEPFHVLSEKVL